MPPTRTPDRAERHADRPDQERRHHAERHIAGSGTVSAGGQCRPAASGSAIPPRRDRPGLGRDRGHSGQRRQRHDHDRCHDRARHGDQFARVATARSIDTAGVGATRVIVNALGRRRRHHGPQRPPVRQRREHHRRRQRRGSDSLNLVGTADDDTIDVVLLIDSVTGVTGGAIDLDGVEHLTVIGRRARAIPSTSMSLGAVTGLQRIAIYRWPAAMRQRHRHQRPGHPPLQSDRRDVRPDHAHRHGHGGQLRQPGRRAITVGGGTGGFDVLTCWARKATTPLLAAPPRSRAPSTGGAVASGRHRPDGYQRLGRQRHDHVAQPSPCSARRLLPRGRRGRHRQCWQRQ